MPTLGAVNFVPVALAGDLILAAVPNVVMRVPEVMLPEFSLVTSGSLFRITWRALGLYIGCTRTRIESDAPHVSRAGLHDPVQDTGSEAEDASDLLL